jgi:hypothetical protein
MEHSMPAMADSRDQAVTGLAAPYVNEAMIRDIWPSIAANAAAAKFARSCYRSMFLAPVAWMALAPLYFKKTLAALPGLSFLAVRYRLTNRRLMICKGMQPVPTQEVPLDQIKDVVVHTDADSEFFFAGTLEVKDGTGKTVMTLPGVREPESVRHHILQAAEAWGPRLHS